MLAVTATYTGATVNQAGVIGSSNVAAATPLYDRYSAILQEAEEWDFRTCTFVHSTDDTTVSTDSKTIDAICNHLPLSIRTLTSMSKDLLFNESMQRRVSERLQEYKSHSEQIGSLAKVLGTMMVCNVLLKPKSTTTEEKLKGVLRYMEKRLSLPRSKLGTNLQQRVTTYLKATAASEGSTAETSQATPGPQAKRLAKRKRATAE